MNCFYPLRMWYKFNFVYFISRFLLYSHKPEMILKEDSDEMKRELLRKDELIKKHYEHLGDWQS